MAWIVASSAVAQSGLPPGNAEKPIDLQAASSDFDYKNNSLLFKRVKITQGDLQVLAQQASATGLDFDNSEWRLQGDVQIIVPGGKLESSEARVRFATTTSCSPSIKGIARDVRAAVEGKRPGRPRPGRFDRLRRESEYRPVDRRSLALGWTKRDSWQHADLRHRP